jgi:hypothetical protein
MEEAGSLYLDLHIHSCYSWDSLQSPQKIIEVSLKKGLSGIAIVDHDTITGGIKAKEINQTHLEIIVGIEIKTEFGDVVGLFLEKEICSRNFFSLVEEIKSQGGLVMLPHPFKKHSLDPSFLKEIDLIEVFNARLKKSLNDKALDLATELSLPPVAGSDAHFPWEIGRGVVKIKKDLSSGNLKNSLLCEERKIIQKYSNFFWEVLSQGIKFSRKAKVI